MSQSLSSPVEVLAFLVDVVRGLDSCADRAHFGPNWLPVATCSGDVWDAYPLVLRPFRPCGAGSCQMLASLMTCCMFVYYCVVCLLQRPPAEAAGGWWPSVPWRSRSRRSLEGNQRMTSLPAVCSALIHRV